MDNHKIMLFFREQKEQIYQLIKDNKISSFDSFKDRFVSIFPKENEKNLIELFYIIYSILGRINNEDLEEQISKFIKNQIGSNNEKMDIDPKIFLKEIKTIIAIYCKDNNLLENDHLVKMIKKASR